MVLIYLEIVEDTSSVKVFVTNYKAMPTKLMITKLILMVRQNAEDSRVLLAAPIFGYLRFSSSHLAACTFLYIVTVLRNGSRSVKQSEGPCLQLHLLCSGNIRSSRARKVSYSK